MLQVGSNFTPEQVKVALRAAVGRCGGSVLAMARIPQLLPAGGAEAVAFTVCFADQYAMMLQADIRFAMLLPVRIAVFATRRGSVLATISPREFCIRTLHRIDLELLAGPLEDSLCAVMEDAAQGRVSHSGEGGSCGDQANLQLRDSKAKEMAVAAEQGA